MAIAVACMAAVVASKVAAGSTTAFPSAAGTWAKVGTAATTLVGGIITISTLRTSRSISLTSCAVVGGRAKEGSPEAIGTVRMSVTAASR